MRKQISLFLMGIAIMMLFVACGKEQQQQDSGTDGYVNVTDQVSLDDMMASVVNWQEAGGKLYGSVDSCIYDISVEQALMLQTAQEVNVTDVGARIRKFCVDGDGNIYWEPMFQLEAKYLHKHLAESGEDVQIPLSLGDETIGALVTDQNGRIYLLLDSQILVLDGDGNVVSRFSGDQYRFQNDGSKVTENLLADSQGNLFYLQKVVQDTRGRVLYQGAQKWVELTGLPKAFDVDDFFLTGEGKIFVSADDTLYEYDLESAESTAVLRYSESNLDKNDIWDIVYVDEEHFLTICLNMQNVQTEMYLLTRTPAEEVLPKKEIVLASISPSPRMLEAVAKFNRMSKEYTVVIERYGMSNEYEGTSDEYPTRQAAITRLNGSLVGSDPPDLLDMGWPISVATYAEMDALTDLYPYFKKSDVLDIADYLENVVEGYTVNGRLVCLPTSFDLSVIIGRTSQVGSEPGWTFEDLNAVLEEYPDRKLFIRNYMLRYFLYDHYVNTFVDPETGKCNFDSDEFREFILWIEKYKLPQEEFMSFFGDYVPEDVLLEDNQLTSFYDLDYQKVRFGDDITFIGHVTKAGTPSYEYTSYGKVGIVESSKDKDGAWAFLEYYISSAASYHGRSQIGFPTNQKELMKMAKIEMETKGIVREDGSLTSLGAWGIGDDHVEIHAPTQEDVDTVLDYIDNIDFTQVSSAPSSSLDGIVNMLLEDLEPYYLGQKSLEEVTRIFNNRVQLMVDEGR